MNTTDDDDKNRDSEIFHADAFNTSLMGCADDAKVSVSLLNTC